MEQIADGTYRLGSRGHNFYLLTDGDEATIVDAGCSREWGKLTGGLTSLGLSLDAVAGVVATHAHADHFGIARQAREHDIDVAVHRDEQSRAEGTYSGRFAVPPSELPMFNLRALRNFLPMVLAGAMKLDHVRSVELFEDGQTLDLPGHPVVVHTPGHTEGHAMFHVPDRGLLFTGDGLATMDLLGSRSGPQMMDPRFHLDAAQAASSLDRITDLEADVLLPGHGLPWHGSPARAVALARG